MFELNRIRKKEEEEKKYNSTTTNPIENEQADHVEQAYVKEVMEENDAQEDDEEEETTSNKFEGVVIGEEVEVEVREQNYTIPDPIKAEIE